MKPYLLAASLLIAIVSGCSSKTDPNEKNFGAAIAAYLDKKGELCLNNDTWPIDVTEMDVKLDRPSFPGKPSRMSALESAGLVSASAQELDIKNWRGQPTGRKSKITRYELTTKGKSFFHPDGDASEASAQEIRGKLCYGKKALDKVVKWEGPMKLGDYQEAGVKYRYKVDGLADWATNEKIQVLYPVIKQTITGAGTDLQSHGVHLTSEGWEANGIDN